MDIDLNIFPSESSVAEFSQAMEPSPVDEPHCRCGQPVGVDDLDTFGCRIPTPYALRCACSRLQQLLDS